MSRKGGYTETGIFNKKQVFNAQITVVPSGGTVAKLSAYVHTKSGVKQIKKITKSCTSAEFDILRGDIPDNRIRVTAVCRIKVGFARSKTLKLSVSLNV